MTLSLYIFMLSAALKIRQASRNRELNFLILIYNECNRMKQQI